MPDHVEDISTKQKHYVIHMQGTMDGVNTRGPVGYQVYDQAFEPNLSVKMKNVGTTPVHNPWLIANGKDWRTVSSVVKGVIDDDMSDAEKALALWTFQRGGRFHASPYDRDNGNVIKMLNVYGYTLCGDDSYCLADLCREVGLPVRAGKPIGHSTTEVYYDDMWHLLDGDEHVICLMRDNKTIAGEEEIVRDHDLMKRTHSYGVLKEDDRQTDEFCAALFPYEGERENEKGTYPSHEMTLVLRPGEALEWRWDHKGKFHGRENMGSWRNAWSRICNGQLRYDVDVKTDRWRCGAVWVENVADMGPLCAIAGEASAVFEVKSPYAIVGGRLCGVVQRTALTERFALFVSFDGETWKEVWTAGVLGAEAANVSLDRFFPPEGEVRYGFFVKVVFCGAGIDQLVIESDLQMAPLSLPGVCLGDNDMLYVDDNDAERVVQITHMWQERDDQVKPPAPDKAIYPVDGADVEGTKFVFEWSDVSCDNDIVDYHIQVSADSDMRYVVSPNFEKLISKTDRRGYAQYAIPYVGLLNPGQRYYWRVRARSDAGLWGDWSAVWSFVPQAPGVPVAVSVDGRRLSWLANEVGRRPLHYFVYGSDERGFTASDEPYPVLVERNRTEVFQANLIGEVEGGHYEVAEGEKVWAYYRVVAVDGNGVRSGASDLAEAQRPFIWSRPKKMARIGEPYQTVIETVRSVGDLRTITIDGNPYNPAFRGADVVVFELVNGPDWLQINKVTGELWGTALEAGTFEICVVAKCEGGHEDRLNYVLVVS